MKYIDLTHAFTNHMPVFPGDPSPELAQSATVAVDGFSHFDVKTGMHAGTHMDGPAHMVQGGKNLYEYPAEKFFGSGVIIDARGKASAGVEMLERVEIKKGDIVLVCFGWSSEFENDEYYANYPEITEAFANRLGELGASIIGTDSPSPDRAPYIVHKVLFKYDILIIENLTNLEQLISHKNFEVIALPTKFQTDSAPVRVVAKIID